MSLLKRIGGSGPLDANGEQHTTTGNLGTGQIGTNPTGPVGATSTLPRQTARMGNPNEAAARQGGIGNQENMLELKNRVQQKLIAELDPKLDLTKTDEVRRNVEEIFSQILESENIILSRVERARLFEAVAAEILGFGPIEPLLKDNSIDEIMVNGPKLVYIERHGRIEKTNIHFQNDEHVMRVIDRIVAPLGRRIDESSPYVDARLPDGSRVNAVIPPLSLVGPILTIRKFRKNPLSPADLVSNGTLTQDALDFLRATVRGRTNVIVVGGTGSGKTTLLNTLSSFISPRERIITIEDAAELRLQQVHVLTLESRPPNIEGTGAVAIRDLLRNSLRMRPDRIVVGECHGGEALDMLQAM